MHVLNNWLAFGLALAFGDMASTLNPTGGSWWSIPVTLTQSLVYLGLVLPWRVGWASRIASGRPFWRAPSLACKVSSRFGASRDGAGSIGIWCNWQHDWFWSS